MAKLQSKRYYMNKIGTKKWMKHHLKYSHQRLIAALLEECAIRQRLFVQLCNVYEALTEDD